VVLVLGEEEGRRGAVGYRDMAKGIQEEIPAEEAMRRLRGVPKEG
jgi:histidyl-tRNA synthetase